MLHFAARPQFLSVCVCTASLSVFTISLFAICKSAQPSHTGIQQERTPHRVMPEVLCLRGPVAKGYGRGGKKLGVPTANLPKSLFKEALSDMPTGVYCGWATVDNDKGETSPPIKAVVNVGYSPTFVGVGHVSPASSRVCLPRACVSMCICAYYVYIWMRVCIKHEFLPPSECLTNSWIHASMQFRSTRYK
jgi:hypothetical protein